MKPSIVTGMGCICAAGLNLQDAMKSMYEQKRNPQPPKRILHELPVQNPVFEITSDIPLKPGAAIGNKRTTRTTKLALGAAFQALEQAGLSDQSLRKLRIGVCLGTTVGCTLNNEPFYKDFKNGKVKDTKPITDFLNNNPSMFIKQTLGLTGPAVSVANACAAGTDAIGEAWHWIDSGCCDIVIAGGTDELSRITYLGFNSLMVASDEPCRPFDAQRKGLNLGEGAGIVVLESVDSATSRKAPRLAHLTGYSCCADAYHPTGPHPDGRGLRGAIKNALDLANIQACHVAFINAHGTSTNDNDRIEGKTIMDLFGSETPVVSTKSYTGHTLGAAGGIEAVFTIQGLLDQMIPATAGFEQADPNCYIIPTRHRTNISKNIAISNSLAFGGNNSVLVFERRD